MNIRSKPIRTLYVRPEEVKLRDTDAETQKHFDALLKHIGVVEGETALIDSTGRVLVFEKKSSKWLQNH